MANLIIKSSADNLVLQGSDASPAITVGATGTTTFAENATLSGSANVLGTINPTGTTFPAGHILQTVQVAKLDTWTHSANTSNFYFITGMEKSITLSNASNKVLVTVNLMVGCQNDGYLHYKVQRNSVDLPVGNARVNCTRCLFTTNMDDSHGENEIMYTGITYLDDPSESSITSLVYKTWARSGNGTQYVNQCHAGSDINRGAPISTMTLQEIVV
jgi:hypothetical protein